MLESKLLQMATNETIYWWKRDEYYYHKIFSNIQNIVEDKERLSFFANYIFKTFARQYSVHRTLTKFNDNLFNILEYLNANDFFALVKDGQKEIIDSIAKQMKGSYSKGRPISFLSKFAFLINPTEFSLYDSNATDSINLMIKNGTIKNSKSIGKSYSQFIKIVDQQIEENKTSLSEQFHLLNNFEWTIELIFIKDNIAIFNRRLYDKYLWLYCQSEIDRRAPFDFKIQEMFWNFYKN